MEFIDGLDFSKIVRRCGCLSVADACEAVRQAAWGLECSHENGLVHRDIKPSNLMLTAEGLVKLLDLGLAQIQESECSPGDVTGWGQVMGTPDYMSPEQALESHAVDIRTDIYSLGCTLFYLLTGRPPFGGPQYDTPMKKVSGHIRDNSPAVISLRADAPKPLGVLIAKMLAKDPADRPATPTEVAAALAPFCEGSKLVGLLREAQRHADPEDAEKRHVETSDFLPSAMVETSRDEISLRGQQALVDSADFDPYHRWLGIPAEEQPPHHYRLLGLAVFEEDPEVIRDAAARQMAHVRTYHLGQHAALSQKILNELGAAKACVLDPQRKAAYDQQLRARRLPSSAEVRGVSGPPPVIVEKSAAGAEIGDSQDEADLFAALEPSSPVSRDLPGLATAKQPLVQKIRHLVPHMTQWLRGPVGIITVAGGALAAILLGVIIAIQTPYGTVKADR